jgi:DNA polymerase-3 subunit epsilon
VEIREIILDTETTGLDPANGHRIVEIGALEMRNKVLTGNKFHYYVNPERDMPSEAYRIHGISGEFLKDKPLFSVIADELLEFIGSSKLVIHNAVFDIKFLNHELSLINKTSLDIARTIDTLTISRKLFPGAKVNLDALCKKFNIDNSIRKFHGALKDAALLAEVYVELTGGRQVSFSISTNNRTLLNNMSKSSANLEGIKIIVIEPTKEELENHKRFLSKISGPVWLN